ncbi:MAG: M1 family metallopeptidase [Flavobacteriales bacterium]|nr:M1 family metallopeptidase [Flavobacteriales bacterium]
MVLNRLVPIILCLPSALTAQEYFQQQVDYSINVRLDDERHELHAQESFRYTNRAPVALDTIWIHLWPNAYRDRTTALCEQMDRMGDLSLHFAPEQDRGWIDSLDFSVDGAKAAWGYHARHADIGWVKLPTPVQSGRSVTLSTPFRVRIPDGRFSRLGHSKQAYYITQWYPKPAVYDRSGWHAMPYLTLGEFYSEFGSFDVTITLPENYVVGATGVLQTSEESAFLEERARLPLGAHGTKESNGFPSTSAVTKTIRYTQDRVHDFAWFADKRFIVRKGSVTLPRSGRTVSTWVMFTPKNALLWSDAITYVNESVRLYSQWVSDYPYDACTAIDGTISAGGGMEYPMITVIGNMGDKESLDNVIAHEVGHNWFYGILGSNERDHAWMDEGINSFVELRYMRERYPNSGLSIDLPGLKKLAEGITDAHRYQSEMAYRLNARRNLDQPLALTSDDYTTLNYGTMVYMKTALIMDHLMAYLGEETMDKCMQAYFEEWKFKHPRPEDMKKVFERESGKNLSWVFEGLLKTDEKLDVKAEKLRAAKSQTHVWRSETSPDLDWLASSLVFRSKAPKIRVAPWRTIPSPWPIPFPVTGYQGTDSLGTIWLQTNQHGVKKKEYLPWPNADRIRIDAGNRTLDIDRRNNEVRAHGLFKRWALLKFESMLGLERNDRRSIYYTLLPAWNGHDGWQAGLALRNTSFPSQRTEWVVAPLYAFGSDRIVGAARIEHHFDRMRSRVFQNIHLGFNARTSGTFHDHDAMAWYDKLSPSIRFDLKREPLARPWAHTVNLRGVRIYNTSEVTRDGDVLYRFRESRDYLEISHVMEDTRKLHPTSVSTSVTAAEGWIRGSLEARQGFAYNEHGKQLRLRVFAGSYLHTDGPLASSLEAWGLTWGPEDMLYDHAYFERGANDRFLSRQFSRQQGAFKTPFLQGGSDSWIASLGLELDFPFKLPLAAFATAGWVPITTVAQDGKSTSSATYVEAGIGIQVVKDVLEVWVPLYVSERIRDEEEFLGRDIGDRIRFVFALEKLDPTRIIRSIRP